MQWLTILKLRFRTLFHRAQVERELQEELEFHSTQSKLTGAEQMKEACRDARGVNVIEHLVADIAYGWRLLRRTPGFTVIAVATLALGIGSTTAIFAVVDAVLLRPLPYLEPSRLVRLWEGQSERGFSRNVVNGWNFLDWRDRNRSFERMAAVSKFPMDLTGEGDPVSVPGAQVSTDFFPTVGVQPELGRWFQDEEAKPGKDKVVILSRGLWQSRYGGDKGILGRRIELGGAMLTVVGVMPEGFRFVSSKTDVWTVLPIERTKDWKSGRFLTTVARLKPGVTVEAATADLQQIARGYAAERPDQNKGWSAEVVPLLSNLTEDVQLPLLVLLGAVGFLLLVACANVANLMLMRGAERTREVAVRAALGASRGRLIEQLVTESLLLASLACVAGVALGYGGVSALPRLIPPGLVPRMDMIHLDARVMGFAVAVSIFTTVIFGLFPALRLSRVQLQDALKRGTRGATGGQRSFRLAFVTAQVALALVLVSGAALMARSFARLTAVDPGFRVQRMLSMNLALPFDSTPPDKRSDYFTRVQDAVATVPGVEAASTISMLPLEQRASGSCYGRIDEPKPNASSPGSDYLVIGPGYMTTMGIAMLAGREFTAADRVGAPSVAVVSRGFALKVFGRQDVVGQRLNLCWSIPNPVEIVGVSADIKQKGPERQPRETIFVANRQAPTYGAGLVIRTAGDPAGMEAAVVEAIHRVNPRQAVSDVRTLEEVFSRAVAEPRFQSVLLGVFAGIALLLAAMGVYGVVAYSVTQRTREIGIRMALGASRGRVAKMVLNEGMVLATAGIVIGLVGALALARVIGTLLYEVAPTDPLMLTSAAIALAATVVVAAIVPARRASKIAPVIALREE